MLYDIKEKEEEEKAGRRLRPINISTSLNNCVCKMYYHTYLIYSNIKENVKEEEEEDEEAQGAEEE